MIYGQGGTTSEFNTHYTGTDGCFIMLLASTKPTNKLLALQKDVFDISKITVIGSPTITSDGVASDLDDTANILFPIKNENLIGKSWTISGACLPVAGAGSRKFFAFGNNAEPSFGTIAYNEQYNRVDFQFKTGDTTSSSAVVYIRIVLDETPSKIYFNLNFDRNSKTYTLKVKTDTSSQWQEGSYIATTDNPDIYTLSYNPTQSLAIRAWANNTSTYTWSAPVDLKCYSVKIEGKEVYTPTKPTHLLERRKDGFDLSKFTVVGNPTITDDGVASGFSAENYIVSGVEINIPQNGVFSIKGRFKSPVTFSNGTTLLELSDVMGSDPLSSKVTLRFNGIGQSNGFVSNAGTQIASLSTNAVRIQPENIYDFEFNYDGNLFNFIIGTMLFSVESEPLQSGFYTLHLGRRSYVPTQNWTNGQIDLPSISITVVNKEIFTGAKEQFYMLRR